MGLGNILKDLKDDLFTYRTVKVRGRGRTFRGLSLSLSLSLGDSISPKTWTARACCLLVFSRRHHLERTRGSALRALASLRIDSTRSLSLSFSLSLFLFLSLSLSLGEMLTTNALSFCLSRTATRMPTVGEDEESSSGNYRLDFQSSHSVIRGRLHDYHEELQQIQHAKLIRQVAVRSPALDSAEVLVRRKRRTGRANEFS